MKAPLGERARAARLAVLVAGALSLAGTGAHAEGMTPISLSVLGRCPERPLVEEALARRGFAAAVGDARFRLALSEAGTDLDLTLRDDDGLLLLERSLPRDDCGALAETVAMLVERRLDGVAWRSPAVPPPELPSSPAPPLPAPPPPREPPRAAPRARANAAAVTARRAVQAEPAWSVDLSAGVLYGTSFKEGSGVPGAGVGLRLRPAGHLAAQLAVGWLPNETIAAPTGSVRIDRAPIALSGAWSVRWRTLELDLGLCAEAEVLAVSSRGMAPPGSTTRLAVRAGPTVMLGVALVSSLRLVVSASALGVLSGWDFVVAATPAEGGKTRVASQVLALDAGVALAWRFGA